MPESSAVGYLPCITITLKDSNHEWLSMDQNPIVDGGFIVAAAIAVIGTSGDTGTHPHKDTCADAGRYPYCNADANPDTVRADTHTHTPS